MGLDTSEHHQAIFNGKEKVLVQSLFGEMKKKFPQRT
jgi:hypothetical protein